MAHADSLLSEKSDKSDPLPEKAHIVLAHMLHGARMLITISPADPTCWYFMEQGWGVFNNRGTPIAGWFII